MSGWRQAKLVRGGPQPRGDLTYGTTRNRVGAERTSQRAGREGGMEPPKNFKPPDQGGT